MRKACLDTGSRDHHHRTVRPLDRATSRAGSITVSDQKASLPNFTASPSTGRRYRCSSGAFHADHIAAEKVDFKRLPVTTHPGSTAATGSDRKQGPFLPVTVDIGTLAIPDIRIGQAVAGQGFHACRQRQRQGEQRQRRPDPRTPIATMCPTPNSPRTLRTAPAPKPAELKAQLAEPRNGILAGLLHLARRSCNQYRCFRRRPTFELGRQTSRRALDGKPTVAIDGHHSLSSDGLHHIDVKGGGNVDPLLPPTFRPLLAGQTSIDVAATFDGKGKIDIQTETRRQAAVACRFGTLDPAGNNSLNANLLGTAGPVDFRWPMQDGEVRALISRVDVALTGAAPSVKIDASAALDSATTPQGQLGQAQRGRQKRRLQLDQLGPARCSFGSRSAGPPSSIPISSGSSAHRLRLPFRCRFRRTTSALTAPHWRAQHRRNRRTANTPCLRNR